MSGWDRLREEVDETNRWYAASGDRHPSISAFVGYDGALGWYGGTAYEGETMEETAVVERDVTVIAPGNNDLLWADILAREVAERLVSYRADRDRELAELEAES